MVDGEQVRRDVEDQLREKVKRLEALVKTQAAEIERLRLKLISAWGES